MTILCYKKMNPSLRLAEKIKKNREEQNLTIEKLSEMTRIPLKYTSAIEEGSFTVLPKAKAHRVAYIKELAKILNLPPEDLLEQFQKESGLEDTEQGIPKKTIRLFPFASISIFLRNAFLISLVFVFAGYLTWQVKGILKPPQLAIFSPADGHIINHARTNIIGETERESKLTVNGQEVMVSEEGKFNTEIDLSEGVNTVVISATKKHGKTTTITRHIVVKLSPSDDKVVLSP